jgi:hypothetical protein
MTAVQLIVTGELERRSLHRSLGAVFSELQVRFLPPQKMDDFTSTRLGPYPTGGRPRAAKLAAALVAAVHPGRRSDVKPDLVIAVEDLELVNGDQPAHVVDYFGHAVRAHVEEFFPALATRERVYQELRERASFHLLAPMVEAYFFGEPAALGRAGANKVPCLFDAKQHDAEHFEVTDTTYLGQAPKGAPWDVNSKHRHPKHYIQYLCDPQATREHVYRETHEGVAALEHLEWRQVLRVQDFTRFARSLLVDLADGLTAAPGMFSGELHPLTERKSDGLLRNIK